MITPPKIAVLPSFPSQITFEPQYIYIIYIVSYINNNIDDSEPSGSFRHLSYLSFPKDVGRWRAVWRQSVKPGIDPQHQLLQVNGGPSAASRLHRWLWRLYLQRVPIHVIGRLSYGNGLREVSLVLHCIF